MGPPWSRLSKCSSTALKKVKRLCQDSVYMEMVKSSKGAVSDVTLAVLHDIRMATVT